MSADAPSKELLEQAGALTKWLLGNEQWQPYRGKAEIEQCSHSDRKQRVKPVINAMNMQVSSKCSEIFMLILTGVSRPQAKLRTSFGVVARATHSSNRQRSKCYREKS